MIHSQVSPSITTTLYSLAFFLKLLRGFCRYRASVHQQYMYCTCTYTQRRTPAVNGTQETMPKDQKATSPLSRPFFHTKHTITQSINEQRLLLFLSFFLSFPTSFSSSLPPPPPISLSIAVSDVRPPLYYTLALLLLSKKALFLHFSSTTATSTLARIRQSPSPFFLPPPPLLPPASSLLLPPPLFPSFLPSSFLSLSPCDQRGFDVGRRGRESRMGRAKGPLPPLWVVVALSWFSFSLGCERRGEGGERT